MSLSEIETQILQSLPFQLTIILVLMVVTLKLIKKYLKRLLQNESLNQKKKTLVPVLYQLIRALVLFVGGCIVLQIFNISTTPLVTISSSLALVVGVGAQQTIKDLISGFFILSEDQFNVGDVVKIAGVEGRVIEIGLRTTKLRNTVSGEIIIVPNSQITIVLNQSVDYLYARCELIVPTIYNSTKVMEIIENEIDSLFNTKTMLEKPRLVGITKVDHVSTVFTVTCKVKPSAKAGVEASMLSDLKKILDNKYKQ